MDIASPPLGEYLKLAVARFRGDVERVIAIANATNADAPRSITRRGAVKSFTRTRDSRADVYLKERLLHDQDPIVRLHAASALGLSEHTDCADALTKALADTDDRVFAECTRSLLRRDEPVSIEQITANAEGRSLGAKLRIIGHAKKNPESPAALELLTRLADDDEPRVRRAAISGIEGADRPLAVRLAERELSRAGTVDAATYKNIIDRARTSRNS